MSALEDFRQKKNDLFFSLQSPLTEEQKKSFKGLNYFSENTNLLITAPIEKFTDVSTLPIQTSRGDSITFRRFGKIKFQVNGLDVTLTIFQDREDGSLFLPFKDGTTGKESYEAGRYVEPVEEGGKIMVDFNYAYNPYCAYNDLWRCPLTPFENNIKARIEAGEKKFHS